jgi:hypothetical protein
MKKFFPFGACETLIILTLMIVNFTPIFAQTEECPAPANLQVSNVTMHEATLTWEGPAEPVYEMRVYADGVYQDDQFYTWPETNNIVLENLLSNADYVVRLFRHCPLFTESAQVEVNFKTLPDCDPPTNFQFNTGIDSVAVTWDAAPSAGNIVSLTKGGIEVQSFQTNDNGAVFYDLEANTIYKFNLIYICTDGSEQFYTSQFTTLPDCSPMYNLQLSNITTSSVTINWEDSVAGRLYEITLIGGDDGSQYLFTEEHTATYTNLQSNTPYQVSIDAECRAADYVQPLFAHFKTLPDCSPVQNFQTEAFTDSVAMTWDGIDTNEYTVSLYDDGILLDSFWAPWGSSAWFSGLHPNTTYEVQMVVQCPDLSQVETWYIFTTLPEMVSYCTSNGVNAEKNHLAFVSFADINRNSGSDGGYSDNTAMSANVTSGASYILTLKADGLPNKKYMSAWIDFNADGDFDDLNEQVANSTIGKNEVSTLVEIPAGAMVGTTRMRIVLSHHKGISPCGSYAQGETEDYTIIIHPGTSGEVLSFEAYPNPVTDALNFKTTVAGPITIINSVGTVMFTGKVPNVLPVSTWPKGFYYIVISGDSKKTIRIAKN